MLMITVNLVLMVLSFEIYKIELFVDITLSAINFANVSLGLSGIHWEQTFIGVARPEAVYRSFT